MIKTTKMLHEEMAGYSDPANKIARMVRSGEIVPVIRGLYETDPAASPWALAGCIYGPSYISFDAALSYHGLIPEGVRAITSATFEKRRTKTYETPFGTFLYQDVPARAFPHGLLVVEEEGRPFRIASAEKALCDKLYALPPVSSRRAMARLLFEDLRIDEAALATLDDEYVDFLADQYQCRNVRQFAAFLERGMPYA